ncbi:hypothetical protein EYR40_007891 [Pleurotus pulmonarius]|nr:hypothetical protein EYR38_007800 [Pleurotus pulmonarius]KAF4597432.1 hypothetical protein EYR40_007891 [Pleurotus pulmonarius]
MASKFTIVKVAAGPEAAVESNVYAVFWSGPNKVYVEKVAPKIAVLWKRMANDEAPLEETPNKFLKRQNVRIGRTRLELLTVRRNGYWEFLTCHGKIGDVASASPVLAEIWEQRDLDNEDIEDLRIKFYEINEEPLCAWDVRPTLDF